MSQLNNNRRMTTAQVANPHLTKILERLVDLSAKNYYNPYQEFVWPEEISASEYWMSPELMSVYGTPYMDELSESQLVQLSKWECVNFFSINVHGIRGLLQAVIQCVHMPGFEASSEYFHHFIGEENEHMWFFAQFCLRYGGKIYQNKGLKHGQFGEADIEHFLSFARILIFEEMGDFYNVRMRDDERLHPIIRQISRVHHQDESRHLAMGREIVKVLHGELHRKYPLERLQEVASYLKGYMKASIESLYNPAVYRDAGIEAAYELRRRLLSDAARQSFHERVLSRTVNFFERNQIFVWG